MAIYTKGGDRGTTSLVGGARASKSELRVEAYGTVDELNAALSLATKPLKDRENRELLKQVQHWLFALGAELATPAGGESGQAQPIESDHVQQLELAIDGCMGFCNGMKGFVLPGRTEVASRLHLARTLARRAERRMVALHEYEALRPTLLTFINRLSDYLYALARYEDQRLAYESAVIEVVERYRSAELAQTLEANGDELPLGQAMVRQVMQQACDAAQQMQLPVTMALCDRHGNAIFSYRMPDALLVSGDLAAKKAYSAVALTRPTHELSDLVQPGAELYQLETMCAGKLVTFGGGLPLFRQGRLVGGIGISGGSVAQDIAIARAAIKGLNLEEVR